MGSHLAIYTGSFDPITLGHLDVLARTRKLFDEVILAIGRNPNKEALFTFDERLSLARQLVADIPTRYDGFVPENFDRTYSGAVPADVAQACLPGALQQVTVWMGPRLHVVHYPVRGARLLNVVAIMAGPMPADPQDWDGQAQAPALLRERLDPGLRALLDGAPAWRLWALHDRTPLQSAAQMARGRVALLGDAAHPMRPYLAQGAGMAIEDAQALAQALQRHGATPTALSAYAQARWARNARVQARALRQGQIYHAQGPVAWARNSAMRLAGARLMDLRWLYAGGPSV